MEVLLQLPTETGEGCDSNHPVQRVRSSPIKAVEASSESPPQVANCNVGEPDSSQRIC